MATRKGLEPSTSGVTGRRSNQLNYRAILLSKQTNLQLTWQGQKGSNPRHAVLETAALPTELYPYFASGVPRGEQPSGGPSGTRTRDRPVMSRLL